MQKYLILGLVLLSGCSGTKYTFYCASPSGLLKADGNIAWGKDAVVDLTGSDGSKLIAHLSNCIGVEAKK